MKDTGRWFGVSVMLANSFIWLMIGHKPDVTPLLAGSFITANVGIGFLFGYWYDKAKTASIKDDLTQTYNRRFVRNFIPGLFAKTSRKKSCLTLTLIDCDDFKDINDQYGHHVGDSVLQGISQLLLQNTRKEDYVVRWGGDEFLIITENGDHASIYAMADRLNQRMEELSHRLQLPVSVSIGTAVYPFDAEQLDELIKIADSNMYENKHQQKLNMRISQTLRHEL